MLVPTSENPQLFALQRERVGDLREFWKNNIYSVQVYGRATPRGDALQLVIRRHDEEPVEGWDDLQRIKNEIAGPEATALEVFPPHDELVDQANLRHLFVLPPGVSSPFTIQGRWS